MKQILTSFENNIGTITFNNNEKRNALTIQLLSELIEALDELEKQQARAVILRAKPGSNVWSAGLFIDELPDEGDDPLSYNHPFERALRAIQNFPAPIIVLAEGSIWGGACDLATVCDMIIGTKDTTFAITPARLGVAYNSSGILHVIKVFGFHTAKEMFLTAMPISAEKAEKMGAINHLVPAEEIEDVAYKIAKTISYNSPLSVAVAKKQINLIAQATSLSTSSYELIEELRMKAFNSKDFMEGKKAFKEHRQARFTGE